MLPFRNEYGSVFRCVFRSTDQLVSFVSIGYQNRRLRFAVGCQAPYSALLPPCFHTTNIHELPQKVNPKNRIVTIFVSYTQGFSMYFCFCVYFIQFKSGFYCIFSQKGYKSVTKIQAGFMPICGFFLHFMRFSCMIYHILTRKEFAYATLSLP